MVPALYYLESNEKPLNVKSLVYHRCNKKLGMMELSYRTRNIFYVVIKETLKTYEGKVKPKINIYFLPVVKTVLDIAYYPSSINNN